jgi:hypothetical protein
MDYGILWFVVQPDGYILFTSKVSYGSTTILSTPTVTGLYKILIIDD